MPEAGKGSGASGRDDWLPPDAIDTHIHVFGPASDFPYAAGRSYTPADALPDAAAARLRARGVSRAVLVQPIIYGSDNSRHLTAAREIDLPARVVVAPESGLHARRIAEMHHQGARGVRIFGAHSGTDGLRTLEGLDALLAEAGWHAELMIFPADLLAWEPHLARLRCGVVIDHVGMIRPAGGTAQPAFLALQRLLDSGRVWVKVARLYRLSEQPPPFPDMHPFLERLVAQRPDRLLWGSDWPHPVHDGPPPGNDALVSPLMLCAGSEEIRRQILVRNPEQLYGF